MSRLARVGTAIAVALLVGCTGTARHALPKENAPVIPKPSPTVEQVDESGDPVIAAVGDLVCSDIEEQAAVQEKDDQQCQEAKTVALVQDPTIRAVLILGDNQYYDGSLEQYNTMYDKTWGQVKDKSYPVPGNHEYYSPDAKADGYFTYFGARAGERGKGWYSFDIGTWHIIALNTGDCTKIGGCSPAYEGHPADEEYRWLVKDLADHPGQCTLAYWHQPLFAGGEEPGTRALRGLFAALYDAHADVVLNGHDHDYERFGEQDADGNPKPGRGIREFIVGTGGRGLQDFVSLPANTEARFNDSFGVLKLTLHPTSYSWEFLDAAGSHGKDAGSTGCHSASAQTAAQAK